MPPSASSGVSAPVVTDNAREERPPVDLFKSIFESESESESEEEEEESAGEAAAASATGKSDATTIVEQRTLQGVLSKTSVQRGYGTDSSDESTGREQLEAEHRMGDHHSKHVEEEEKAGSDGGVPKGDKAKSSRESGSGTRRSESGSRKCSSRKHGHGHRSKKKNKKHKSDRKDSKSEKKQRKHGERKKKRMLS